MAGNSKRRGAVRSGGGKKGASVGSGGQRRKGLAAKGPTPKAEDRTGHPAARKPKSTSGAQTRRTDRPADDIVVGRNAVVEALRARVPAEDLIELEFVDSAERITEAVSLAGDLGVPVRQRPKRDLDKLAGSLPHQGLVLRAREFGYADVDDVLAGVDATPPPMIVALDGITDPHNFGAIARSASAFGASALLIPSRRSAGVTAAAWRSSAGAFAHIRVARATNLVAALVDARERGFFIVGLDGTAESSITAAAEHYSDVPVVLVVGSEGEGISRLAAQKCDTIAAIPMPGRAESLNASVATGVALFALMSARSRAPQRGRSAG